MIEKKLINSEKDKIDKLNATIEHMRHENAKTQLELNRYINKYNEYKKKYNDLLDIMFETCKRAQALAPFVMQKIGRME